MTTPNTNSQVKRFVAPNMRRALDLVREEMGPEAVILSSKKVKNGVEIITSVDLDLSTRGIDTRREFGQKFDTEVDSVMPSDFAWRANADVEKAASNYSSRTETNDHSDFKTQQPSADLAREIEKARERMFEAKRQMAERDNAKFKDLFSREPVAHPHSNEQPQFNAERHHHRDPLDHHPQELNIPPSAMASPGGQSQASQYSAPSQHTEYGANHNVEAMPSFRSTEINEPHIGRANSNGVGHNHFGQADLAVGPTKAPATQPDESEHRLNELQGELEEMRMLLEQQLWRMSEKTPEYSGFGVQQQMKMPNHFSVLHEHMARLGLTESIVNQLTSNVGRCGRASEAWRKSMANLAKMIPVCSEDMIKNGGTYAFVGQTGVGKTTTIAKLAANYVIEHGPGKVALVTTDTYRVGAYDQLRSIGRILNVPVKAVDSDNSLLSILAKLRDYDLVLVDTAGFRHGDPLLKAQLNQIDSCSSLRKVLVLASTSQLPTLKASIHSFSSHKPIHSSIITKLDETGSMGEVISAVLENQLQVAYTTDGQEIPKDIVAASGHGLVAKAVALVKGFEANSSQTAGNL